MESKNTATIAVSKASKSIQVNNRLDDLQKALDQLEKNASVLGSHLERVMLPNDSAKSGCAEENLPDRQCPLANMIAEKTLYVWKINEYLKELEDRLDI